MTEIENLNEVKLCYKAEAGHPDHSNHSWCTPVNTATNRFCIPGLYSNICAQNSNPAILHVLYIMTLAEIKNLLESHQTMELPTAPK
jgi:hypothetical protein